MNSLEPRARQPGPKRCGSPGLEQAARAEVNARAGREISDEEWIQTRGRLIAFVNILRLWEQRAKTHDRNGAEELAEAEDDPQAA